MPANHVFVSGPLDIENMSSTAESEPVVNILNGDLSSTAGAGDSAKRKRNTRACDRCHQNACKCSPGIVGVTCKRCEEQGVDCTFNRPVKRRGPPVRGARHANYAQPAATVDLSGTSTQTAAPIDSMAAEPTTVAPSGSSRSPRVNGEVVNGFTVHTSPAPSYLYLAYEDAIKPEVIEGLVDVFYHTVYPIRPYFHWPTFNDQVRRQLYRSDWGIFVVTMAVCALTAGRLYSGVPIPPGLDPIRSKAATLSSECYAAAVKAMPRDIASATDYCQAMKASALLASVCLQNGHLKMTIAHLGDYISLAVMHGFYTEANWPVELTEIERQERRRLFWAVYHQDQYLSSNFGLPSRIREAKTTVLYPAEVFDDEDITATSIRFRPERVSFLRGWNYCTDLYRLFENTDTMTREWQNVPAEEPGGTLNSFFARCRPSQHFASDILHLITTMHKDLPQKLKTVRPMTGNPQMDRYGFVGINIILTTSNLKMLLVGAENPNVHIRCAIASELLDELGAVPVSFFNASSTSSLHHLAHAGHVLGSAIQSPFSAWSYLQVRNILLVLADFLEKLQVSRLSATPNLAAKLRTQINRIDQCMQQTSQRDPQSGLASMGQSLLLTSPTMNSTGSLNHSNEQHQLSPPPSAGIQIPTVIPSVSRLTRLFGVGDQLSSDASQQQRASASIGAPTVAQEFGFGGTFDMSQQCAIPNPGPDLGFPPVSSSSIPTDFFDGWPILSGQADAFDPLGNFVSFNGSRSSLRRSLMSTPPANDVNGHVNGNGIVN